MTHSPVLRLMLSLIVGSLFIALGFGDGVTNVSPLWTLDLASSGYQPAQSIRDRVLTLKSSNEGLAFSDDGTVVAYFVTKADLTEFSNRKDAKSGTPFRLRAVFGDVSSRKIMSTRDWPTKDFPSSLHLTDDGKFVVRAGDALQLYSRDFTLIKERVLESKAYESWDLKAAPSGQVLWLDDEHDGRSHIHALDAHTLNELAVLDEEGMGGWFSGSDHAIARSPQRSRDRIMIKNIGGPWRVLYSTPDPGGCASEPTFLNNEMLIAGPCDNIDLISAAGEILMKDKPRKGEHIEWEVVAASRNGKMAAVSLRRTKGGTFDTAIHRSTTTVVIYDLERRSAVMRVDISPLPTSSYHIALSPDGALLAVMTDSIVKIYHTNNAPAEHSDAKAPTSTT